jgi:hypothetical protein
MQRYNCRIAVLYACSTSPKPPVDANMSSVFHYAYLFQDVFVCGIRCIRTYETLN